MNIDWSKAPDWARGRGLVVQGSIKEVWFGDSAYMIVGDNRSYVWGGGGGNTHHNHMPSSIQFKQLRPEPWTGEGLPPVGTVCERNVSRNAWCQSEIFAHSPNGVYAAYADSCGMNWSAAVSFRPIRTPEQIAADKRLHEIRNALTTIKAGQQQFPNDLVRGNITLSVVESMIDAGYRKQANP